MTRTNDSVEQANVAELYRLYRTTTEDLLGMMHHGSLASERKAIKELIYDLRDLERYKPRVFAQHAKARIEETLPKLRSGQTHRLVEFLLCLIPFVGPYLLQQYHQSKLPQSQRQMQLASLGLFSDRLAHSTLDDSLESLAPTQEDLQCSPQAFTMGN